jgi:hypothetical protein
MGMGPRPSRVEPVHWVKNTAGVGKLRIWKKFSEDMGKDLR